MRFALIAMFMLASQSTQAAAPLQTLVRQPRTMAMGGAGVGLADDEYALFQNPAGLAGSDDRRFKLLGLGIEASWDAVDFASTAQEAFKDFKIGSLNKLMGKDIAFRTDLTPMIKLPGFSVAYIFDFQGSLNQFNQANPYFDLGYQTTQGVQAGWGWALKNGRHAHDELRVGVAAKVLWRRGGFYNISTVGFLQASSNGKAYIDNLVGSYGMGIGGDLGVQYVDRIDKMNTISYGASITDVFDTKFSDPHASKIPMSMNLGVGYKTDFGFMKLAFAADLRNLNQRSDFANKTHIGTELSIPLFDFYLGANQLNATYGAAFDIWVLRVTVSSYAEELGVLNHQSSSRKAMAQIDFSLPI